MVTQPVLPAARPLSRGPVLSLRRGSLTQEKKMAFTLPPLPYPASALEPHIDAKTMEIHHGKHHGAYVTNLNKALESAPDLANKTLEELLANNLAIVPEGIRG